MSERSAKWLKKRSYLDQREAEVKSELSAASTSIETGIKKVLIATAAVGATLATGYMLYQAFKPKKKKRKEEVVATTAQPQRAQLKKSPRVGIQHAIMERLILILVQAVGTQIALLLSRNKRESEHQSRH